MVRGGNDTGDKRKSVKQQKSSKSKQSDYEACDVNGSCKPKRRFKLKKFLTHKFLRASKEETKTLLSDEDFVEDLSPACGSKEKKKKKKRFMKRVGKFALSTCRYIGIGIQTLSTPGIAPHVGAYMPHGYNYAAHPLDPSYCSHEYHENSGNVYYYPQTYYC